MGAFECVSPSKMSPTESTEVFTISMASNTTLNEPRRDVESQSTRTGCSSRHSLWWKLGIDLPLLVIFLILVGLFELGLIPSHQAGFTCNDPALSYKYNGDTVTTEVLISMTLLLPIVFLIPIEYIFSYSSDFYGQSRVRQMFRSTFVLYRTYTYGLVLNFGIVEVIKGLMGSPRPTFFDLCEPDTGKTCNGSAFVSHFTCTPNKYASWLQMDSYRSFPSGHTSFSVYTGFFLAWYLQRRVFNWQHRTIFLVPMLQLLFLSYSAIGSLTRITDHRHHWWDVLAGTVIGLATVYYTIVLTDNFARNYPRPSSDVKSEQSQNTVRTLLYEQRRRDTVP